MKIARLLPFVLLSVIAIALILLASPSRLFPSIPSPSVPSSTPRNAPVPTQSLTPMPPSSPPQVSTDALMEHVRTLAFERYSEGDRQRARDYLIQTLTSAGWSSESQGFNTGVNLVAQRPGTDPDAGSILVAAHYDTVENTVGADDNTSGVAVVLEVARLLGDRPTPRTLKLALFDQEEAGLVGSFAYTEQASNLANLQGTIILEMVGYTCHTVGCQRQPDSFKLDLPSDRGDFVAVVGDTEHLPLLQAFEHSHQSNSPPLLTLPVPFKGVLTPIVLLSDHTPFWYQGIGAVMVTDTAFLRNPHYHRPSDVPSTLDATFFTAVAQMVVNTTTALLESQDSLTTATSPPSASTAK